MSEQKRKNARTSSAKLLDRTVPIARASLNLDECLNALISEPVRTRQQRQPRYHGNRHIATRSICLHGCFHYFRYFRYFARASCHSLGRFLIESTEEGGNNNREERYEELFKSCGLVIGVD
jgi:hypothetical protein